MLEGGGRDAWLLRWLEIDMDKCTSTEVVLLLSKKSTDGTSGNPGDDGSWRTAMKALRNLG